MDKIIYTENDFIRFPSSPVYGNVFESAKKKAVAGDIVLWDKQNQSKLIVTLEQFNQTYKNDSNFVGIAVVVVPASHTPDGTIRCVVPKYMNYTTPEVGNDAPYYICWGYASEDIEELPNITSYNYLVHGTSTVATATGQYSVPSNSRGWNGSGSTYDTNVDPIATLYRAQNNPLAPSPYGADGISPNPEFFVEGGLNEDMDGKGNTDIIIANTTADWSGTTINNSCSMGDYPAACCCRRFTSDGIAAGDVYLPAAGEVIYLISRNAQIVDSIKAINPDLISQPINGTSNFWASTEFSMSYAWCVSTSGGNIYDVIKSNTSFYYVLGFVAF